MGDCIMAFWNAPLDCEEHAEMAVKTAIECAEETERLKEDFKERGLPDINIGSGVNTGTCIVGNMGSEMRLDYFSHWRCRTIWLQRFRGNNQNSSLGKRWKYSIHTVCISNAL